MMEIPKLKSLIMNLINVYEAPFGTPLSLIATLQYWKILSILHSHTTTVSQVPMPLTSLSCQITNFCLESRSYLYDGNDLKTFSTLQHSYSLPEMDHVKYYSIYTGYASLVLD